MSDLERWPSDIHELKNCLTMRCVWPIEIAWRNNLQIRIASEICLTLRSDHKKCLTLRHAWPWWRTLIYVRPWDMSDLEIRTTVHEIFRWDITLLYTKPWYMIDFEKWPWQTADLEKCLSLASPAFNCPVRLRLASVLRPLPRIGNRLRRREHVKRNRKCAASVDVVHPKLRSRELPLDVTVAL